MSGGGAEAEGVAGYVKVEPVAYPATDVAGVLTVGSEAPQNKSLPLGVRGIERSG